MHCGFWHGPAFHLYMHHDPWAPMTLLPAHQLSILGPLLVGTTKQSKLVTHYKTCGCGCLQKLWPTCLSITIRPWSIVARILMLSHFSPASNTSTWRTHHAELLNNKSRSMTGVIVTWLSPHLSVVLSLMKPCVLTNTKTVQSHYVFEYRRQNENIWKYSIHILCDDICYSKQCGYSNCTYVQAHVLRSYICITVTLHVRNNKMADDRLIENNNMIIQGIYVQTVL